MTWNERLQQRLAEIESQGGTGEIVHVDGLRPFLLYTMAEDPRLAATHLFTTDSIVTVAPQLNDA